MVAAVVVDMSLTGVEESNRGSRVDASHEVLGKTSSVEVTCHQG